MTAGQKALNMETKRKLADRPVEHKCLTTLFRNNCSKLALIIHVSRERTSPTYSQVKV